MERDEELRQAELQNAVELAAHIMGGALRFLVERGLSVDRLELLRQGDHAVGVQILVSGDTSGRKPAQPTKGH